MNAIDWLAKQATYNAHKVALIDAATDRRFTYAECHREAMRFAGLLESLDIKRGGRVCVLLPNCPEVVFVLFGATRLGAIFVPLNFKLAIPELIAIVADAQPSVLIYSSEFASLAAGIQAAPAHIRCLRLQDASFPEDAATPPLDADIEDPQMLLYTSGTTGQPKGVILSHRHVFWNAVNTSLRMLAAGDTVLIHTPMFYTGGLNVFTLPAFLVGATVAIMRSFDADEVLRQIERLRITAFFAVPTQLQMMADAATFHTANLSTLRYVISGGAPCPVPLIQRWVDRGVALRQGFGLTEVGPNTFALDADDAMRKAGSIGFPNFSVEARIVDHQEHDVRAGEIGELLLRTPAMCSGYWNQPELTREAIRDGWFHTGDLASRDAEGYCYIVDRKKDMFISGGENVYPAEIEHSLREHPRIADVAVVGLPDPKWGEAGCAVVVLQSGESVTEQDLLSFCSGRIAKFKIPRKFVFASELPRTISGKVRKQDLKRSLIG